MSFTIFKWHVGCSGKVRSYLECSACQYVQNMQLKRLIRSAGKEFSSVFTCFPLLGVCVCEKWFGVTYTLYSLFPSLFFCYCCCCVYHTVPLHFFPKILYISKPHRYGKLTAVDVAWSVCLFAGYNCEPLTNGWTDQDAVWVLGLGPGSPEVKRQFLWHVPRYYYRERIRSDVQKQRPDRNAFPGVDLVGQKKPLVRLGWALMAMRRFVIYFVAF